jgi:hypothetical protein
VHVSIPVQRCSTVGPPEVSWIVRDALLLSTTRETHECGEYIEAKQVKQVQPTMRKVKGCLPGVVATDLMNIMTYSRLMIMKTMHQRIVYAIKIQVIEM